MAVCILVLSIFHLFVFYLALTDSLYFMVRCNTIQSPSFLPGPRGPVCHYQNLASFLKPLSLV